MTNKDIFKIWAPFNKKWVNWVRPVPFIAIDEMTKASRPTSLLLPYVQSLNLNDASTAIIVDLPGSQSVDVGMSLAERGYRPIPIYNGTSTQKGARATTDNHSIAKDLVWGASILSKISLKDDAPPAFLTDSNRLQRRKIDCSVFDNSWDVYHQDLPSEEYFLENGITKIVVISNVSISRDLKKIFAEYAKKKISIFWTDGYDEPKCVWKGR